MYVQRMDKEVYVRAVCVLATFDSPVRIYTFRKERWHFCGPVPW
jgi:hypothetical protein